MSEQKPRGRPTKERPHVDNIQRLYCKEGKTIRETAMILGVSKDLVYRALKEYKLKRRGRERRSMLLKIAPEIIEKEIRDKGMEGAANTLGVHVRTLYYFIAKKKNEG